MTTWILIRPALPHVFSFLSAFCIFWGMWIFILGNDDSFWRGPIGATLVVVGYVGQLIFPVYGYLW